MSTNSNLSCIPFYTSLDEQDYRKWYAYGEHYKNMCSKYLNTFFLVLPSGYNTISSATLTNIDTNATTDIKSMLYGNGIVFSQESGYATLAFLQNYSQQLSISNGQYYITLVVTNGTTPKTYYSDVLTILDYFGDKFRLEWGNNSDLKYEGGKIPYSSVLDNTRYQNRLYLCTEIGKPTYNFTEEGEERNGFFFPTKQISEKVFNFGIVVPEYICDVMRTIRMADNVQIVDEKLNRTYDIEQFEMSVNWLENGYFASVDCSFQTDTVIKKIGKAY